jgi:RNA polymerase sigma-54 factor
VSLAEHLLWQISETPAAERVQDIARAIVGNIKSDGYLVATVEEIQAMGGWGADETLSALRLVQTLDPVGVAARDLAECLCIQLHHFHLGGSETETIVRNHLDLVRRHRFEDIGRELGLPLEQVMASIDIIRHLDPKPGSKYSDEGNHYVVPDVYVVKVDGEYQVVLNEEGLPRLRISPLYRRLLAQKDGMAAETRQFVNEKFKAALWLIRSLEQRQKTIHKVAESIVKYQRDFLDKGIDCLRPLVLRDVAEDISMHESTVSRVVTNKYMHTPQGLFEMKYFFHSSIHSDSGADVSSLSVKKKIRKYIEEEDPSRPLSDSKIVKLLKAEGLEIARRTVAKYREEMRIASSTYRRQVQQQSG